MKVNRTISLDTEIAYKLVKEDNYSELINSMLIKHYQDLRSEDQIIADVKNIIKAKADKKANYDKYNNPKHLAKRRAEMKAIKKKNGN